MTAMTAKQEAEILRLAGQLTGNHYRFISQAKHLLPVSNTAAAALTTADASFCIDSLKAEIEAKTAQPSAAPAQGAPTAADILAMLGQRVTVTFTDGDEKTGTVTSIKPSPKDGTPALVLNDGNSSYRVSVIASWTIA